MNYTEWDNSFLQRTITEIYEFGRKGDSVVKAFITMYFGEQLFPYSGLKDMENAWETINILGHMATDKLGADKMGELIEELSMATGCVDEEFERDDVDRDAKFAYFDEQMGELIEKWDV